MTRKHVLWHVADKPRKIGPDNSAMRLACNMTSSMPLGKQARALASDPEHFANQTHVGKHAQMQHAQAECMYPLKRYGKHT